MMLIYFDRMCDLIIQRGHGMQWDIMRVQFQFNEGQL